MPSSVGDAQEAEPCSELTLPSTISADSVLRDTIFFHAGFYEQLGHPHYLVMLRQACKAFAAQAQPMTFSPSSNRAAQASWWSSWHPFGVRALLSAGEPSRPPPHHHCGTLHTPPPDQPSASAAFVHARF